MPRLFRIFLTGIMISFLGSLPLGTLNVACMQIAITDGIHPAILFALGTLTAEVAYVRVSLIGMDWVRKQEKLFKALEWITLLIIIALSISSFYAAQHPKVHKNVILGSTLNKYALGLLMSAVNPVQIPFWFGWSTVLFTKKVLLPKTDHYNTYIVGIGIGSFLGALVFIFGGKIIADRINANQSILNWVIGAIFAITAIIQGYKMMRKNKDGKMLDANEHLESKFTE